MTEDKTTHIPEPIGSHILNHKKIIGVITGGGYYYHYADVCTLMKEHAEREVLAEREANKKEVQTLIDLVKKKEYDLNLLQEMINEFIKSDIEENIKIIAAKNFLHFLKTTKPVPDADKLQRVPE